MIQYSLDIFLGGIKMGLFNYNKPGPGISKDAPRKKGIFLYLELLGRKFSKLVSVNMLFFLSSIPMLLLYFAAFFFTLPIAFNIAFGSVDMMQTDTATLHLLLCLFLTFICAITLGTGPASSSMAYIMREFSKEQHVWMWHNFIEKLKENFKKEIVVCIIDLLFIPFATIALAFYAHQYFSTGSLIWFALCIFLTLLSFIFVVMHFYIHQLMVTFENKLNEIFKNALLLTLSTLLPCILLLAFAVVVNFYIFNIVVPVITILLGFIILISFFRFPIEFYVYSKIKRFIPEDTDNTEEEEEIVFSDSYGSEK